jgi:hypothetical protein
VVGVTHRVHVKRLAALPLAGPPENVLSGGELEKRAQRIVDRIGISECLCHVGIEYHDVRALRCQPLGVLSSDGLVDMVLGA